MMKVDIRAFGCFNFRQILLSIAMLSTIFCSHVLAQNSNLQSDVTTVEGVVYSGTVKTKSKVTIITSSLTDVYLTKSAISQTNDATVEPLEIYEFAPPANETPRKGKIGLVVKDFSMDVANDGTATVKLRDPKLGVVDFTAALTKMTPSSLHWSGVEYSYEFSFPINHQPKLMQIVFASADKSNPDSVLRAARFMRQAGEPNAAKRILAKLPKNNEDRKAELKAIKRKTGLAQLEEIRVLEHRGAIAAAAQRINNAVRSVASDDDLAWLDTLAESGKTLAKAPRPDLSDRARLRLTELNNLNQQVLTLLSEDEIASISQRWAATMADQAWTVEQFHESIALSQSVSNLMESDSDQGVATLASRFESSTLPRSVLLEIVRHAPKQLPQDRKWHRIDYVEPVSRKEFHYYVSIPANAGPLEQLPVLVCMHGMNTKADVMYGYWGRWAERHGYIIVSPEYIYGREWGFRYSDEEVHSINGAITHALRTLPIDSNKVFLQGHSQGGHAAWEIGGALAGRLTGVVPLLGITRHSNYLSNYQHTAIYAIDGSKDGGAPAYNRNAMKKLAKLDINATYVEYIGRAHETFYEEYDRVLAWARPRGRDYGDKIYLQASRKSDFRRRWIRIESSLQPLPSASNRTSKPSASVQAEKRKNKIKIAVDNVQRLSILTPVEWLDTKGKLRVTVNNRNVATITPSLDWKYLLSEAHQTGDRTRLYCGQTTVP